MSDNKLPASKRRRISGNSEEINSDKDTTFRLWYSEDVQEKPIYSDWTITVATPDEALRRTFQVHKPILSAKSQYFEALFDSSGFVESQQSASVFEFPKMVVENFEVVLNYAYDLNFFEEENRKTLSPTKISVLLYAGDYFRMEDLVKHCQAYLDTRMDDLGVCMVQYYKCYGELGISFLEDFLFQWMCTKAQTRATVHQKDHFLAAIDVEFFSKIILYAKQVQNGEQPLESWLISYLRSNSDLEIDSLLRVTCSKLWPSFDGYGLITMILRRLLHLRNDTGHADLIANLESRCLTALKIVFGKLTLAMMFDGSVSDDIEHHYLKRLLSLVCKDLATSPPENLEEMDSSSLSSNIRDLLKQWKNKHPEVVVALTVSNDDTSINGTYVRGSKGDFNNMGYVPDTSERPSIRSVGKQWSLYSGSTCLFENKDESNSNAFPPLHGWIGRGGKSGHQLQIEF